MSNRRRLDLQKERTETLSASEQRLSQAASLAEELKGQLENAKQAVKEAEAQVASQVAAAAAAASAAAAELAQAQASMQSETERVREIQGRLDSAQAQLQARGGDISVANETIRLREAALDGMSHPLVCRIVSIAGPRCCWCAPAPSTKELTVCDEQWPQF